MEVEKRERLFELHSAYELVVRMKEWPFDVLATIELTGLVLLPVVILRPQLLQLY